MNQTTAGQYFLLVLLIGAAVLSFYIAQPFLTPLALAAVFAVVLQPVYRDVFSVMRRWPGAAAGLTVLFSFIVIILPISLVGTQIAQEASAVYASLTKSGNGLMTLNSFVRSMEASVTQYLPFAGNFADSLTENISRYAQTALQWVIGHAGSAFASIASTVLSTFIFVIALFYFLKDGKDIKNEIIRVSPLKDTYDRILVERLELAVNSVVRGNLTIAVIQGVLTTIGFTIFGIPNSILWGTVAAISAMIPGVGTALVFTPAIVYSFFTGDIFSGVGLLIWGSLAVGMVDNFLGPRLIGSGIRLHPLLVLIAVLGGIGFFGPVGVFLGPLIMSFLFALLSIYSDVTRTQ